MREGCQRFEPGAGTDPEQAQQLPAPLARLLECVLRLPMQTERVRDLERQPALPTGTPLGSGDQVLCLGSDLRGDGRSGDLAIEPPRARAALEPGQVPISKLRELARVVCALECVLAERLESR